MRSRQELTDLVQGTGPHEPLRGPHEPLRAYPAFARHRMTGNPLLIPEEVR